MEIQIDVPKCHLESIFLPGSELGEVITRKIPLASTMTLKYYTVNCFGCDVRTCSNVLKIILDESTQKNSRTETTSIEFSEELGFEWFRWPTFLQFMEAFHHWNEERQKCISEFLDLLLPKELSCPMMSHDVSCWGCPAVMSHILNIAPAVFTFAGWNASSLTCTSSNIEIEIGKNHDTKRSHSFWPSQFDGFGLCCGTLAINLLSCPMLPACSIYISNPSSVTLLCTYLHLCGEHHCGIVHFFRADRSPMLTEL